MQKVWKTWLQLLETLLQQFVCVVERSSINILYTTFYRNLFMDIFTFEWVQFHLSFLHYLISLIIRY